MTTKKILVPALVAAMLCGGAVMSTDAEARGGFHGGQCGNYQSNLTDEQRAKARELVMQSKKANEDLRNSIFVKENELRALHNATNPDVQAVSKAASELTALRQQLRDAREKLGKDIDTALGLEPGTHAFLGQGNHRGEGKHRSYGQGHGRDDRRGRQHGYGGGQHMGNGHY